MSQHLGKRNQERSVKSLAEDYEYLFSTKGRKVAQDLSDQGLKISMAKQLLSNIFEVIILEVYCVVHNRFISLWDSGVGHNSRKWAPPRDVTITKHQNCKKM